MNRDNDKGKILIHRSLIWLGMQIFLLLVVVIRLYYLQVHQADKYAILADENRISTRLLVPARGIVFDRNKNIVAGNQQNFSAMIVYEQTPDVEQTLATFKKIIPLSAIEEEKIKSNLKKYRKFMPIKIKDGLNWDNVASLMLELHNMPGVFIDDGLNRYYPYEQYMSHVLGYVSLVSEKDLKNDDDPLLSVPSFKVGKSGIEQKFEPELRGQGGNLRLEVNAYGRVMSEIEKKDGVAGKNISLTIDANLQKKAFELMGDEAGAIVVMDIYSGEVLALVSTPSFDSNDYVKGLSQAEFAALLNNEKKPLMNKAISGQYSPGSTFKMIVALAALEEGIITPETKIGCSGKIHYGKDIFHCWKKDGHGEIDLIEAIKHSCDVYFYEVSQQLGIDKIAEMAHEFGLGFATDIELAGEKSGLIPNKSWKLNKMGTSWQGGETIIAGIGQGYVLTTPVQLAVMTSILANGGIKITPTLIKDKNKNGFSERVNVSSKNIELMKKAMHDVVNAKGGTAYMSKFVQNGAKMSGKTGTTQVRRITLEEREIGQKDIKDILWKHRNHALFVGFAPHNNPRYAVSVLVEHGGGGSSVAAPLASKLMQEVLKLDDERK